MGKSDPFKAQHKEIMDYCTKISAATSQLPGKAADVRTLLAQLGGKVVLHLQMEDNVLYKTLKSGSNAAMAGKFETEMSGIKTAFTGFMSKYSTPQAIGDGAKAFQNDWKGIETALKNRIAKEEKELYPAFDKS